MQKLGKYNIIRELGKGAMGTVYEGFDPLIQRTVAIKSVQKATLDQDSSHEMLHRFRREAQAAGRLTHPHIVAIYEYGEDDDVAFIVMEFIQGRSLKSYFDNNETFTSDDIYRYMSQLLDALEYSHQHGVIHRDIKPGNIIINERKKIKVADFGIARIESSELTHSGTLIGTPSHMSPEQFTGLAVDKRTDIYSAGVILYQFITGEKPFTGSIATIMHKVLTQEPPLPSSLNTDLNTVYDHIIKKALAKQPEDRYPSAHAFLEELAAAFEASKNIATQPSQQQRTIAPTVKTHSNEEDKTILISHSSPHKSDTASEPQHTSNSPNKRKWPYLFAFAAITAITATILLKEQPKPSTAVSLPALSPPPASTVETTTTTIEPTPRPVIAEQTSSVIAASSSVSAAKPTVTASKNAAKTASLQEITHTLNALEQEKAETEKRFNDEENKLTKEQVDLESKLRQLQAQLDKEKQESDTRLKQDADELENEKKHLKSIEAWPFHTPSERETAEIKVKSLQTKYDKKKADYKAKFDQDQNKIDKERNDSRTRYINAINALNQSKNDYATSYQTRHLALEKQRQQLH